VDIPVHLLLIPNNVKLLLIQAKHQLYHGQKEQVNQFYDILKNHSTFNKQEREHFSFLYRVAYDTNINVIVKTW
jgi:hypothetical protein